MGEIPKKDAKNLRNLVQLADEKKNLAQKNCRTPPPSPKKINGPSLITCLEYKPYHGLVRNLEGKANTSGNYRIYMKIPC